MFSSVVVFAQENVSVADLIASSEKYHQKEVSVTGRISNYKEKTSKHGKQYTVFHLRDGNDYISVYSQGHKGLKNDIYVRVIGKFFMIKHVGKQDFYNEIEMKKYNILKE